MTTQKRLIAIIALSIFVLTYILPLHNAISECVSEQDDTLHELETLLVIRREAYKNAHDTLMDIQNKGLLFYVLLQKGIQSGIGYTAGKIYGVATANPLAPIGGYVIGSISGATTGAMLYYTELANAKKALEKADKELLHAESKYAQVEQKELDAAISPENYFLTLPNNATHSVQVTLFKEPIREIYVSMSPVGKTYANKTITLSKDLRTIEPYAYTISHTFSEYEKGVYNVIFTYWTKKRQKWQQNLSDHS